MKFTPDSGTVNMTSQPDLDHKYTSSTLALLSPKKLLLLKFKIAVLAYPKKIRKIISKFSASRSQLVENMEVQVLDLHL
jgi:hypothetical protein